MAQSTEKQIDVSTVLQLNDQLASLSSAKVPLSLGGDSDVTPEKLHQLSAHTALETSRGSNIAHTLNDQALEYRLTLQSFALLHGDLTSLELSYQLGQNQEQRLRTKRYSRAHLLTLLVLGGIIYFAWLPSYTRMIDTLYTTSNVQPGAALSFLHLLSTNYTVTAVLYLAIIVLLFLGVRYPRSLDLRRSNNASQLREKRIIDLSLSRIFGTYFKKNSTHEHAISPPELNTPLPSPLLAWAHQQAEVNSAESRSNYYHLVEQFQGIQLDSLDRSNRTNYPILGYVFPGACIVLFLGVLLFWPLIELLITICLP